MQKKWLLNKTNKDFLDYMSREANVSSITAQILINRDIKTPDAAFAFFSSDINSLSDPMELTGIKSAVIRIQMAIKNRERILIHGDYDCDGITATVIMFEVIKRLGGDDIVEYFIPSRFDTGYGFHPSAVEIAAQKRITLIITVDCGISAFEAVNRARDLNIDVIVTDHHEPDRGDNLTPELPKAYCIINPKLNDPNLTHQRNSSLSGAGVALMLGLALNSGEIEKMYDLIDIATLGTIADVVPLTLDNRIIVREGLKRIGRSVRPGIIELIDISALTSPNFKSEMFSFTLIPRINAAGRMGDANLVVKLLTTDSVEEAKELAFWLNGLNIERQRIESEVFVSAIAQLEGMNVGRAVIIADEDWHEGVLGIVASKLVDRYEMPAFVLNIKDGIAKGSARSIPKFDILKCLKHCSEHLIQFGGHKQAAGLKLEAKNIQRFTQCVNQYIIDISKEGDLITTLNIDYNVTLKEINNQLMSEFSRLEPFGYSNPEPLLGAKGLVPSNLRIVGRNHLKMRLTHEGSVIETIGFDLGENISWINTVKTIDAVFTPTINEWNGTRTVQLNIKDLRPSNGNS
jgi:single-stranded-DNA-specific exonuclease